MMKPDNARGRIETCAKYLKYVLIAAPALACLYLVLRYGVNMIYGDEWIMVKIGMKVQAGTFTLADLWSTFNEHRQLFYRLVYLGLGFLTGFNIKAVLLVSFALVCAGYFVMIRYLFATVKDELWRCAGGLVLGLLMFSLAQYENFLWGLQLAFFMADILPLISVYFLHRRLATGKRRYFIFAMALGVVASFSSAQGLLVWPAALVMLALHYRKTIFRQKMAAGWLAAGAASWFFYFYGLYANAFGDILPFRDHVSYLVKHPFTFLYTTARMAVKPFVGIGDLRPGNALCVLAVACAVALLGFKLVTRYKEDDFFPGAMALFGALSVVVITFSRQVWDMTNSSRYTTATLCIYTGAALYALANRDIFKKKAKARENGGKPRDSFLRYTAAVLLSAIVLISARTWFEGYFIFKYQSERYAACAKMFKEYKVADDAALLHISQYSCLQTVDETREMLRFLEENGYSVFAG